MNDSIAPQATRREWLGLAVLAFPTLLLALDVSVLYLALPHLGADLDPSGTQFLWIMDIYGFMIAGFLVTMGTLGDRIGRRKRLMIGGAAFAVASVFAAFAPTAETLILSRAALGIAGATLMPSTLALISNMFLDPRQRGIAIAAWMSCFAGGAALGPVIGGVLLEYFWWGSVFLMGVPVMILLLVSAPILLPEYRNPDADRLDLVSVALSLATILPFIYGLKEIAKYGLEAVPALAIVAGLLIGVVFVRRQRTLTTPLLDLELFHSRIFSTALGIMLIATVAMGGLSFFTSQYLQLVAELSPLRAGLWMVPSMATVVVATMLATWLAHRLTSRTVIVGGLALSTFGLLVLTQVERDSSILLLVAGSAITSFGMGPIGALCTELVVGSAPPERAGSASALSETSAEFGIAVGVATLGSLGAAVYRSRIAGDMPDGVTAEVSSPSRESLTSALGVAEGLPAPLGVALVDTAQAAFTVGLNAVAGVTAVGLLAFVLLASFLLRDAEEVIALEDAEPEPAPAPPRPDLALALDDAC